MEVFSGLPVGSVECQKSHLDHLIARRIDSFTKDELSVIRHCLEFKLSSVTAEYNSTSDPESRFELCMHESRLIGIISKIDLGW